MHQRDRRPVDGCQRTMDAVISRRTVIGVSGVAVLGLLSGAAFGQEENYAKAKGFHAG